MSTMELFFHLVFVFIFLGFTLIRAYYHRLAQRTAGEVKYLEGRGHRLWRAALGFPVMGLVFLYMFYPPVLAWARISLPDSLRWTGVFLGLLSLPLIWWVQWALGSNFSTTLHIREAHTLVTHGPYRWVRHPMYTALYFNLAGAFLLTANLFIGIAYLVPLTIIVVTRVAKEEAALQERFGEAYSHYMERTGRFLPRFGRA